MDYEITGEDKTERIASLCKQAGGTEYLSGPAAKSYINEEKFNSIGIKVSYFDYYGYQEYRQLHGQFEHGVSIIDLVFNEGVCASQFMKSFKSVEEVLCAKS